MKPISSKSIIWFRNDLRIHDNHVIHSVLQSNPTELLCIYCFDPRHFRNTRYGSKKTGLFRTKFQLEAVENLRENLRKLGNNLIVAYDKPENIIPNLTSDDITVHVTGEVTNEEIQIENLVEKKLKIKNCTLKRIYGNKTLYHPKDIPFLSNLSNMNDVFTIFREKIEKSTKIRQLLPKITQLPPVFRDILTTDICNYDYLPSFETLGFESNDISTNENISAEQHLTSNDKFIHDSNTSDQQSTSKQSVGIQSTRQKPFVSIDSRVVLSFEGGENNAIKRIENWMFENNNLKDYFDIRNGMIGETYSSKLSPWLAFGCLSPKYVYYEIKRYEKQTGISNKSTYWLIFELIWRDFYYYLCLKYGNRIFQAGGALDVRKTWNNDDTSSERIGCWKNGLTGIPLIDANMRELKLTGWMSNRGRQNVASYLIYDLNLDWRIGADYFESLLIDSDVTSNYGNWNAAAGLTG